MDDALVRVNGALATFTATRIRGQWPRGLVPFHRTRLLLSDPELSALRVFARRYRKPVARERLQAILPAGTDMIGVVASLQHRLGERAVIVFEPGAFALAYAEVSLLVWRAGRMAVLLPPGGIFVAGRPPLYLTRPGPSLDVLAGVVARCGAMATWGDLSQETGIPTSKVRRALNGLRHALGEHRALLQVEPPLGCRLDVPTGEHLAVDEANRCWLRGDPLHLEPDAAAVLIRIAEAGGEAVRRDQIRASRTAPIPLGTLYRHVYAIRAALGPDRALLETVPRVGYRWVGGFADGRAGTR